MFEGLRRSFESFRLPSMPSMPEFQEFLEPLAEVADRENEIVVRIELPGVEKKDISLEVTPSTLKVRAEKKEVRELRSKVMKGAFT